MSVPKMSVPNEVITIQTTPRSDVPRQVSRIRAALALVTLVVVTCQAAASEFAPVYEILQLRCGGCHRTGGASSWIVDMPAADRYPMCVQASAEFQCTTHQQLTEVPGPDIPAWVRPTEPRMSEPYVNACDTENSFHIGVSLPEKLPDAECRRLLDWITAGAKR